MKNGELFMFYDGTNRMLASYRGLCGSCEAICYSNPCVVNKGFFDDIQAAPHGFSVEEHAYFRTDSTFSMCKKCVGKND